jgi:hypothetical protein
MDMGVGRVHLASSCSPAAQRQIDRADLWRRQILTLFVFEGLPEPLAALVP